MPVIQHSDYKPPIGFSNPHLQTILPALFRKVDGVEYRRERIDTSDGDFLDLDWSTNQSQHLVIVVHGLESSSERAYVRGMVKAFNRRGYDALAFNFRNCSGEPNRLYRSYHSGDTKDLDEVISFVASHYTYTTISLVGFSLGGNVVLKFLGEQGKNAIGRIHRAVAMSVPCDLASAAQTIMQKWVYHRHFLQKIKEKVKYKVLKHQPAIGVRQVEQAATLYELDNMYTAPAHGFASADDYWNKASSLWGLPRIAIPTLLLSAQDDPMLSPSCFPFAIAEESPYLYLEAPELGGHVGFLTFSPNGEFWGETRATEFIIGQNK